MAGFGLVLWSLFSFIGFQEAKTDIHSDFKDQSGSLLDLYKHLHANPELSLQEFQTAKRMAKELSELGFEVHEKIGGTGVVGILRNGTGPTILVRTDMDALPVLENTGLPYASKVSARIDSGLVSPVMHACGHDVHMTCWVGTARILVKTKSKWSGTLFFVAQPAEEIGVGARAMLEDGLFKRFPKPDYCLALHCDPTKESGSIAVCEGPAFANVDSVDITVKGKGGHGAFPHNTVDPIVLSAKIIMDLQTLVSRETNPLDPAVVTVGSIHGGTKHNIIPGEVKLQLTIRSMRDEVRENLLKGIERLSKSAADGARAPEPMITLRKNEFTPALNNDPKLTKELINHWEVLLGKEKVKIREPLMGGEDFSRYGREGIPACMFFLGTVPKKNFEEKNAQLPSLHSEFYKPDAPVCIETGTIAMTSAVLNLFGTKR